MIWVWIFILGGYLSGSILYARVFSALFRCGDIAAASPDKNPGTANAFAYGGFFCGALTLFFDLAKGFAPVYLYQAVNPVPQYPIALAFVLAAPALGHAFPVFFHFHGGKAIAVSFGCLLGLYPRLSALLILAGVFIFFSLILRVSPNYYRTFLSYLVSSVLFLFLIPNPAVVLGFIMITAIVILKLALSAEEREKCKVTLLWMH